MRPISFLRYTIIYGSLLIIKILIYINIELRGLIVLIFVINILMWTVYFITDYELFEWHMIWNDNFYKGIYLLV